MSSLLIKNGEIVTASERYQADILCQDGKIQRIEKGIPAQSAEVIDATGKYVFPGFIDPHVHIYLPFMGTYAVDTYETASRAAVVGGTTTLIEMCCPARSDDAWEAFELWRSKAVGKSACDFTFHMGVSRYDAPTEANLRRIVSEGISSFKVFLAYKGAFGITDDELYHILKLAKELGVVVTAHCENPDLILELQKQLLSEGKVEPKWHYWSRPPQVEAEGTHHLMTFAEMLGTHVYVVHLSCKEALDRAVAAKRRGVNVYIETLIQYLTLDQTCAELPDFEGAKFVMSPPLRDKSNQAVLWNGLKTGLISTLATDHAPFNFKDQKPMGRNDFTKIPNGIPSLEDRINLLWTYGVLEDRIDIHTFVDCASTQAAKIFGLFPRKGAIQPGADADLVVYDPNYEGTISAKTHHLAVDYSAFEGWAIKGRPHVTTVRGEVAARDGTFVGTLGRGQFLKRVPNHF